MAAIVLYGDLGASRLGVVTWNDMARLFTRLGLPSSCWATLVSMADGLWQDCFIKWFAGFVGAHISGLSPNTVLTILVAVYFFAHYFFSK